MNAAIPIRKPNLEILPCGCVLEKAGDAWFVDSLCSDHADIYYTHPDVFLEKLKRILRRHEARV